MKLDNYLFRYSTGMLLLVCLVAFGCSQKVKVSGTVTYSDTGEPVKFGMVMFTGEKEAGRGTINDGKYSVGIVKDGDGIPRGTYRISADSLPPVKPPMTAMGGAPGAGPPMPTSSGKEHEVYYTEEPETIEIKKSMTYDFQVERGSRAGSMPR